MLLTHAYFRKPFFPGNQKALEGTEKSVCFQKCWDSWVMGIYLLSEANFLQSQDVNRGTYDGYACIRKYVKGYLFFYWLKVHFTAMKIDPVSWNKKGKEKSWNVRGEGEGRRRKILCQLSCLFEGWMEIIDQLDCEMHWQSWDRPTPSES